ncbi:MAG: DUF4194 domain-containing protein [Spirochaetaceae bacterium]|nr:MAG: DUF4194 domain-containing protein [Spirochaetaceae bacterium]
MTEAAVRLSRLSPDERELLREALAVLFSGSFLVRAVEQHTKLYRFLLANFDAIEQYLAVAGWGLRKDETLGVISFTGPPSARLQLGIDDSSLLLVLRLLYEERAATVTLHGERTTLQHEVLERLRVLSGRSITKTRFVNSLQRFQTLKLIRVMGDEVDPETVIVLYPSIAFAVESTTIDEVIERIESYRPDAEPQAGADDENDDTDNGDPADSEAD